MDISIKVGNLKLLKTDVVIVKKEEKITSVLISLNKINLQFKLFEQPNEKSPVYEVSEDGKTGIFSIYGIHNVGVGVWKPMFIATIDNQKVYFSYLVNRVGIDEENMGYRFEYSLYIEE